MNDPYSKPKIDRYTFTVLKDHLNGTLRDKSVYQDNLNIKHNGKKSLQHDNHSNTKLKPELKRYIPPARRSPKIPTVDQSVNNINGEFITNKIVPHTLLVKDNLRKRDRLISISSQNSDEQPHPFEIKPPINNLKRLSHGPLKNYNGTNGDSLFPDIFKHDQLVTDIHYKNNNFSKITNVDIPIWTNIQDDPAKRNERVIEISNFPTNFKTLDLKDLLASNDNDLEIVWVNENHALAVFSDIKYVKDALKIQHPLIKCKPLEKATVFSKAKAKKSLDAIFANMLSLKPRPQTTIVIARRLVENHLGMKARLKDSVRQKQLRDLNDTISAERKKKNEIAQKPDIWDEAYKGD